jgi:tetratricopeptide (TPR) repeat protein
MEKISRIEPYYHRKDREFEPYLEFIIRVLKEMDENFEFKNKEFSEERIDKPYVSMKYITKYGTESSGIEVIKEEMYEQVAYGIAVDKVTVKPYGLSIDLKLEIESTRRISDLPYLEIRLFGPESLTNNIIKKFNIQFQQQPIDAEKLKRELLILNTMMNRKVWYTVETRAKAILEDFPNQLDALFALAIARVALGDLDKGEQFLSKVLEYQPTHCDALYNLSVIYKEKEEYQKAMELLQKSLQISPKSHAELWQLGQVKEEMGQITDAIQAYQAALENKPNTARQGFLNFDFTQQIKEALNRLKE